MKLSVVIPCLNGARTLGDQFDALARNRWSQPWEVVFADNGSTDGSVELVSRYHARVPNLRIIDASGRRGQPYATNTGVHAAVGESILFADADDVVDDGWLAAMGNALERFEFVACRTDGEKLNPPQARNSPQRTGLQEGTFPPWMPHAGCGTMGLHKALFEKLGDFDESLPYVNDTEYCIRAGVLGVKIQFVPEAVLYLRNRSGARAFLRQSMNWAEWGVPVAKRYWPAGEPTWPFWRDYLLDWFRVFRLARHARCPWGKYSFAWRFGRQLGRTKGILKHGGVPV
jgi:glycosyltransferase involved in cell wall biosynthesis